MSPVYDLQKIYTLLNEGFIAEELIDFCRIVPKFQPLYGQQLHTLSDTELIDRLVTHARDVSQLEKLLDWTKKKNPIQYAIYEPYIIDGLPEDVETMAQQAQAGSDKRPPSQTTATDSPSSAKDSSGVAIGLVAGDVEDSTIAGRDVNRTNVRQVTQNVFRGSKRKSPAQRNRQAMLKRVRSFWVKDVLEKSLHGLAMIELGMAEKADAVDNPLNFTLKTIDQPYKMLPDDTKIIGIFKQMDRALLILGEPGSGKTMSLLSLARDTITEAEDDPTKPIPVVFNLSSWSNNQGPLTEWLADELNQKYMIPSKISKAWIENRELLPLLDGLDEVAPEYRNACVETINKFSQSYGLKNIVVCSRIADYEALTHQLKLHGAVLLQPLTTEQVDDYLTEAGNQLEAIKRLIKEDEVMRELTRSPLMLSIMTLAYQEKTVEELRGYGSTRERRTHLFDTYIDRMFNRAVRTKQGTYSKDLTINWLTWLANKMSQHSQTEFLIERMQPTWLEIGIQQCLYGIGAGLIVGLSAGLSIGMSAGLIVGLDTGIIVGLISGVIVGLITGLISEIKPTEVLKWSWSGRVNPQIFGRVGLIGGLLVGMIGGISIGVIGLIGGMSIGLIVGMIDGLSFGEIETRMFPNQGIRQSLKNAVIVGLIGGLSVGLIGGLIGMIVGLMVWHGGLSSLLIGGLTGLSSGLIAGLSAGLIIAGGRAVIEHYTLRLILYFYGHFPLNLVSFLDYAADRILLRKVGGGYIFIHRLLLDHFANLKSASKEK